MQFFVVNELALRGRNEQFMGEKDFDLCFDSSAGNFVNMIKFTAGQDPQFHEALKLVPQNAKYTSASIQNEIIFIFKHMMLCTRGGVEDTRLEAKAKAKDTKKIRGQGQGQGQPFRGQNLSRPRTGMLEAKAKDQGHRRKCSPKKKSSKIFSGDLQFVGVPRIYWDKPKPQIE